MMSGRGFHGIDMCFGNDFIGSGWYFLMMAGVILLVVTIFIYFARNNNHGTVNNQAIELLKMKFVQGEITEEEFLNRKETLLGKTLKRK